MNMYIILFVVVSMVPWIHASEDHKQTLEKLQCNMRQERLRKSLLRPLMVSLDGKPLPTQPQQTQQPAAAEKKIPSHPQLPPYPTRTGLSECEYREQQIKFLDAIPAKKTEQR